jgi:hypothetical protein
MDRDHVEFIQSQMLPWLPAPAGFPLPGSFVKLLSRDKQSGAQTALVQMPDNWSIAFDQHLSFYMELFVLAGTFRADGQEFCLHDYGWFPPETMINQFRTETGAQAIIYFGPQVEMAALRDLKQSDRIHIRTIDRPWENSNVDPNINHLYAHRKNLRLDDDEPCRTYLLSGLPHGKPPSGSSRKEVHPHVEEFFLIAGTMASSLVGTMRAGAYFWRPPGLMHGLDWSADGFMWLCRTPGSVRTISTWSTEEFMVDRDPPYRPIIPDDMKARLRPYIPLAPEY